MALSRFHSRKMSGRSLGGGAPSADSARSWASALKDVASGAKAERRTTCNLTSGAVKTHPGSACLDQSRKSSTTLRNRGPSLRLPLVCAMAFFSSISITPLPGMTANVTPPITAKGAGISLLPFLLLMVYNASEESI